nr:hypothetical protein [Tanacetum cinerariifolium]
MQVIAAPVIPISSDSSEESVGSHVPRVILFGTISATIPVILVVLFEVHIVPADPLVVPKVGAVFVISPTGVLDLVDYSSSSDSDPSEDSLPIAPERHESLTDHDAKIRRRPTILVRPGEAIPFGQPYRTYPIGSCKLLTARKRVRPFLARRLAWRRVSHRSSNRHSSLDFTSDSSSSSLSSDSSLDISSDSLSDSSSVHVSGCDTSGHIHSGSSTRVASHRLVYPSIMTLRYSEAFRRWRSAPLSTPYPPTTSESSLDSSSKRSLVSSSPSTGPSRKSCKSPTNLVPSSTLISRSIAPTLADLLPPRKRFRDSYSPEASEEEHMEIGTTNAEAVADLGIGDGVGAYTKDEASTGGTMEIIVDPLVTGGILESTGGDLEASQLMDSKERADLTDKIRSLGWENLRVRALFCIKRDRVDSLHRHMALSQEEFCQIRTDCDDIQRRLRM